jgi:hypothetical protein
VLQGTPAADSVVKDRDRQKKELASPQRSLGLAGQFPSPVWAGESSSTDCEVAEPKE